MKRIVLVLAAIIGVFVIAGPASAHVTVIAPGAVRGGGDQEITFRVPVEKNFDTVGLVVSLPTATPIASVDVSPVPGWTHSQKTVKLAKPIVTDDGDITEAVSQITWKANPGQGLKPGEFGQFVIIAGQLPDTPSLTFGALQTYSDGSVVRWIQTAAPGSTVEPDFPAPVLTLAKASSAAPTSSSDTVTATAKPVIQKASTTAPTVLAIIAIVLAAAALGFVVVSNARRRETG